MKASIRRNLLGVGMAPLFGVAGVLASLGVARVVNAQNTDVPVRKPNVLLLVDTSASMLNELDGGNSPDCDAGTPRPARWTILAETLTGTIEELDCNSTLPVLSNNCRPVANLHSEITAALAADPFGWPQRTGGNSEQKDAVVFCGKSNPSRCTDAGTWSTGEVCKGGSNEWEQLSDGLLDTYGKTLRFGLMTFDSVALVPGPITHGLNFNYWANDLSFSRQDMPLVAFNGQPNVWGSPDNCQFMTNGTGCFFPGTSTFGGNATYNTTSFGQFSYWHNSAGSSSWLAPGARAGYTGNFLMTRVLTGTQALFSEGIIDAGARNPRAAPSRGRMIGFGPPSWDVSNPGLIGCTSEDECTGRHNEMVQKAILGVSGNLVHTTPIAAMLRDAYEFEVFDGTVTDPNPTRGVHVPHAHNTLTPSSNALLSGKLGPQFDPSFTAASPCRVTANVLISDGEPFADLDAKGSTYSALMEANDIRTFVIGVGLSSATYTSVVGPAVLQTVQCKDLTAADLVAGSGRMCERDASLTKWKYAELPYSVGGTDPSSIRACCNLLEIAVSGGTNKAYFPSSAVDLKTEFNKVLQDISGGTLSRTIPIFNQVSATYAPDPAAPAVYYELRSSLEVTADDTLWRGNLERVRYSCDAVLDVPAVQPVATNLGDRFEENLADVATFERKFFTVVHTDGNGKGKGKSKGQKRGDLTGTLRTTSTSANNHDNLFDSDTCGDFRRFGNNPSSGNDVPVGVRFIASTMDGLTSALDAKDALGATKASCQTQTGTNNEDTCADRVFRWYGGDAAPGGTTPSRAPTNCPSGQLCSPMGGIYRSSPVVVPPPTPTDSDNQNFGRFRSDGTTSFWEKFSTRPTMVYSQTVDGQLHAFALNRNDTSAAAPDFFNGVPAVSSLDNNEMWTFIPPAVLPSLFPNFNVHSKLLDGQLAWSNVVYERPYAFNGGVSSADAANIDHDYATVLVGASGPSAVGGFYYALDVTNPKAPRFLWQLRTAGNDDHCAAGEPLFGNSVPGAAITHIRYLDSDNKYKILAVAVLPGGSSTTNVPSGTRNRSLDPDSYWPGAAPAGFDDRQPRPKVRNWGYDAGGTNPIEAVPARSLTIVELKTGRILARMVGNMSDNPNRKGHIGHIHNDTILDPYVVVDPADTPFDSPITGIPVPYPAGIGKVAERIYVGDADGTLWRVDIGDPKPTNTLATASRPVPGWQARIAFDAYNHGSNNNATLSDAWAPIRSPLPGKLGFTPVDEDAAARMGQPIQTAPLLSLDDNGEVVVTFSTGDQEDFNTVSTGMINLLVSFTDQFDGDIADTAYPPFRAVVDVDNGLEMAWENGGRVTGPINLFDGQLYFAYFAPASGLVCAKGTGGLCGVAYNNKEKSPPGTAWSPAAAADLGGTAALDVCRNFSAGEVVFGISINLVPSCVPSNDTFNDPWLAGQYSSITQSNLGRYQLVYHTGQGGSGQNGAKTKSSLINLPTPQSRTRVRTWVSVVE